MKIDQTHINQIQKQFNELESKEDLVKLLSDARNMLYGQECKPFQLKALTYYSNPKVCRKRYKTFNIKKKSGADRTINAPVKGLKAILRSFNFVLQCLYKPHENAIGFVLDKSIVDNAQKHVGHHYVLNLDLKDFFHSFDKKWVKYGLMSPPFNLHGDKEPLAFLLASLVTHPFEVEGEVKNVLPQGSPTSPTLTNILCQKLDRRLNGLANRFGATFTRYADDITFSSPHTIYNDEAFNNELKRIIEEDQKLAINPKKTRLQKADYRQEATGLIVNDKVNVRRRYVKQIRMWLYYWEKYGYEKAEQIFKRDYIADKGHVKNINAHLVNVLDGKLEFLKMVKGIEDGTYKGLKERFDKLTQSYPSPTILKLSDDNQNRMLENETVSISNGTPSELLNNNKINNIELIVRPLGNSTVEELMVDKYLVKGLKLPHIEIFENPDKYKPSLPHNPEQTTILLTEFKNDGSGFKELVHKPFDEITPYKVLEEVKNHPNFSEYFKKGRKSGFKGNINREVQNSVIGLINSFERIGNMHWDQFKEYPFGEHGSSEYTTYAMNFKKNYRFGPRQDGYTSLEELIRFTFLKEITRFDSKLIFLPDDRRFNLRGSFYTWVPSVKKGLEFIAQGINEHSNICGSSSFSTKEIYFELRRDTFLNTISLLITDSDSVAKRPAEDILKDLRLSEVFKKYFRSICDWTIYLKNEDGNFQLRVLKRIQDTGKEDIISIEGTKGFTHKITFYGT
ncbi:reverse transcriptase family protein [Echinicola marina]|uniref:reverse transcriptase domain-containing protein n=1 Tax=Echinicola marina TaxID=2859768 RepID=UPI001CF61E7B|nr:reverse transcriptase domain-containing protein [Echinicola marina]UCS94971.1 reverse transcriptase family protein [Echinicola marina]